MKRLAILFLLSCWLAMPAMAQDLPVSLSAQQLANIPPSAATIVVTPDVAEDRHPIVADLNTEIPDGATVYGNGWTCSDGVRTIPASTTKQYIWADPGEHTISYDGVWIHTEDKAVVVGIDDNGKPIMDTVPVLLGMGMIDTEATFVVEGDENPQPGPDPEPDPNPVPPGPLAKMRLTVVEETKSRTPQQAQIILDPILRKWLTKNGHEIRLVDKDQPAEHLAGWIAQAGKALPHLFLAVPGSIDDGVEPVWEGPLPESEEALLALCKEWGAEK